MRYTWKPRLLPHNKHIDGPVNNSLTAQAAWIATSVSFASFKREGHRHRQAQALGLGAGAFTMNRREQNTLLDRHERIVAAILTRFRNMVDAATAPLPSAPAIPHAALNSMVMHNESSALIHEIENLLSLTREIKKLWIAGPLRKPGDADEKSSEKVLDERAARVAKYYETLVMLERENAKKKNPAQQNPSERTSMKDKPADVKSGKGDEAGTREKQG
ncbi:hypothetical protein F4808DRAFT_427437 [Astrocystis sublimbata]|nr:hypothetical protein F4808DRAFT_427437 [Astrocystis sublimbata]